MLGLLVSVFLKLGSVGGLQQSSLKAFSQGDVKAALSTAEERLSTESWGHNSAFQRMGEHVECSWITRGQLRDKCKTKPCFIRCSLHKGSL